MRTDCRDDYGQTNLMVAVSLQVSSAAAEDCSARFTDTATSTSVRSTTGLMVSRRLGAIIQLLWARRFKRFEHTHTLCAIKLNLILFYKYTYTTTTTTTTIT